MLGVPVVDLTKFIGRFFLQESIQADVVTLRPGHKKFNTCEFCGFLLKICLGTRKTDDASHHQDDITFLGSGIPN